MTHSDVLTHFTRPTVSSNPESIENYM